MNWYDLYRPVYPDSSKVLLENRNAEVEVDGEKKTYKRGKTLKEYTPWAHRSLLRDDNIILGYSLSDYINLDEVRKAMNIPSKLPGFDLCREIGYTT